MAALASDSAGLALLSCLALVAVALYAIVRLFPAEPGADRGERMRHNHLTQMLIGGGVIAAVLLLAGVSPSQALVIGAALACPLMMVAMIFFMQRGSSSRDCSSTASARAPRSDHQDLERMP